MWIKTCDVFCGLNRPRVTLMIFTSDSKKAAILSSAHEEQAHGKVGRQMKGHVPDGRLGAKLAEQTMKPA